MYVLGNVFFIIGSASRTPHRGACRRWKCRPFAKSRDPLAPPRGQVFFFPRILEVGGPVIRISAVWLFVLGSVVFLAGATARRSMRVSRAISICRSRHASHRIHSS